MNNPSPAERYRGLREMALNAVKEGISKPPESHADVYGMVIDIAQESAFVTLVCLTDDTTSMYVSTGGGIIGAGQKYPQVAKATQSLLACAQRSMKHFREETSTDLPPASTVRFHILTESQRLFLDIPEAQFWGKETITGLHFPMIMAAQQVINTLQAIDA